MLAMMAMVTPREIDAGDFYIPVRSAAKTLAADGGDDDRDPGTVRGAVARARTFDVVPMSLAARRS